MLSFCWFTVTLLTCQFDVGHPVPTLMDTHGVAAPYSRIIGSRGIGDMNNDGTTDFVMVSVSDFENGSGTATITVRYTDPDFGLTSRSFEAPTFTDHKWSILAFDMNDDGLRDVVVYTNRKVGALVQPETIYYFPQTPDGFGAATPVPTTPNTAGDAMVLDTDENGTEEMYWVDDDDHITVWRGTGSGVLREERLFTDIVWDGLEVDEADARIDSFELAGLDDVDQDGCVDAIGFATLYGSWLNPFYMESYGVVLDVFGQGVFHPIEFPSNGDHFDLRLLGDFDGDSLEEFACRYYNTEIGEDTWSLFAWDGIVPSLLGTLPPDPVRFADFCGDGVIDLYANSRIYPDFVPTTFTTPLIPFSSLTSHFYGIDVFEDFNGDGAVDTLETGIVVNIAAFRGNTPHPLGENLHLGGRQMDLGDLDGDGDLDLAVGHELCENLGDGYFVQRVLGNQAWASTLPDLNGDGLADVVMSGRSLISEGDFQFSDGPTAPNTAKLIRYDVNGDGREDVIGYPRFFGGFDVCLNLPGRLECQSVDPQILFVTSLAVGDINADGLTDFATQSTAELSVLLGNLSGEYDLFITPLRSGANDSLHLVDLDGDGWDEIVVVATDPDRPLPPDVTSVVNDAGNVDVYSMLPGHELDLLIHQELDSTIKSSQIADIDRDGRYDLLVTLPNWLDVYFDFTAQPTLPEPLEFNAAGSSVLAADVNADGVLDLLGPWGNSVMISTPPPCDADLNGDSFLDSGDIGKFVSLYLTADPRADLNADGFVDSGDISLFVEAFLSGC